MSDFAKAADELWDDYGIHQVGNTLYRTGPYSVEQLEKMLRAAKAAVSGLNKLIERYRSALGESAGDIDDDFDSDEGGSSSAGGFVGDDEAGFETGEPRSPSADDEATRHSELWSEYQRLDNELTSLEAVLNELRERYQRKVDAGEIEDTVRDPGRSEHLSRKASSEVSSWDDETMDMSHLAGKFADAPIKDPKIRKPPAPKQMELFGDMGEMAASLPPGVSVRQSGYGDVYR